MIGAKEHLVPASLTEDGKAVLTLDQSLLPGREVWLTLSGAQEMYDAIKRLQVRGAPAIGVFAGSAVAVLAGQLQNEPGEVFRGKMKELGAYLESARPTAVNLHWAVARQLALIDRMEGKTPAKIAQAMREEAEAILSEDIAMCRAIAEHGLSLLSDGDGVLTHCNAGALATSMYGTALGPFHLARERGMTLHIYADETRPLLQGARLTAYELDRDGIDVTLICDNMASFVMKKGLVKACFVGCDRVAANGDTANKIGTSGVAVLARHYGIPFYVLGPTSSIDPECPSGEQIPIEFRDPDEIRSAWYREPMTPASVKCLNPAFDVTDHELITGIITEKGILYPPFTESIAGCFAPGKLPEE